MSSGRRGVSDNEPPCPTRFERRHRRRDADTLTPGPCVLQKRV